MNAPIPHAFHRLPLFGITVIENGRLEARDHLSGDQIPPGDHYSLLFSAMCEWGRDCDRFPEQVRLDLSTEEREFLQAGMREQLPQCSEMEIRQYIGKRLGDYIYGVAT